MFKRLVPAFFQRARGDSASKRKIKGIPVKTNIPNHVLSYWSSMTLSAVPYISAAVDAVVQTVGEWMGGDRKY